jgi:hypothetical protein
MYELSLVELECELAAELPTRALMRRRRMHSGGAHAAYGSAAASNSTSQSNVNPQTFINTGRISGRVNVTSNNRNTNTTTQNLTPLNIGLGF